MTLKLILKPLVWLVVAFSVYELYTVSQGVLATQKHSLASLTFLVSLVVIELVLRYLGSSISDHRRLVAQIALMLLKASFAVLAACEMNRGDIMLAVITSSATPQIQAFTSLKAHVLGDLQADMTNCWQSQMVLRNTRQCNSDKAERLTAVKLYPPQFGGSLADRVAELRTLHQELIGLQATFVCVHVLPDVPPLPDGLDTLNEKTGSLGLLLLMMRCSSVWALIFVTSMSILLADLLLLLIDALWKDKDDTGISKGEA